MSLKHRIAHLFGWNHGSVETWWKDDQRLVLMVGFRCECGALSGVHESRWNEWWKVGRSR